MSNIKVCNICQQSKDLTEFPRSGNYNNQSMYRGECKACNRHKHWAKSKGERKNTTKV